jgi:hypothetical protein
MVAMLQRQTPWTGPKRIIVHAGLRKTGTTSIQDFLSRNAARLPRGIAISPRDDLTKAWRRAVAADIEKPARRAVQREARALRTAVQGIKADILVISDENLSGQSVVAPDGRDIFDLAATYLPMIEEAFYGAKIEFVIYTRAQDLWLKSAWAQGVKRSGIAESYENWRAGLPQIDPKEGLARLRSALKSPLHICAMEDDLAGPAPLIGRALFALAGLDNATLAGFEPAPRANESLPEAALGFLLKLNALELGKTDRRLVARLVEDHPELFAS